MPNPKQNPATTKIKAKTTKKDLRSSNAIQTAEENILDTRGKIPLSITPLVDVKKRKKVTGLSKMRSKELDKTLDTDEPLGNSKKVSGEAKKAAGRKSDLNDSKEPKAAENPKKPRTYMRVLDVEAEEGYSKKKPENADDSNIGMVSQMSKIGGDGKLAYIDIVMGTKFNDYRYAHDFKKQGDIKAADYYCPRVQKKNRYDDIRCIRKTRVILPPSGYKKDNVATFRGGKSKLSSAGKENFDGDSYINANHIKSDFSPTKFIACQGPIEETIPDFWHMIVTHKVPIIVMLCNLVEDGDEKCSQYWPNFAESKVYGEYTVTSEADEPSPFLQTTLRKFKVVSPKEVRVVKQYQVTNWADHYCPPSVVEIVKLMRSCVNESKTSPIVTHCSAGVGRTGSFICIWYIAEKYRASMANVDVMKSIEEVRKQRSLSVQTRIQFIFLKIAIIQYWFDEKIVAETPKSTQFITDISRKMEVMTNKLLERKKKHVQ
uniref:Tyrosine-protein phosphatase domain-containing protein n=1 Tax=Rhabditophanes sp. KR3021 TaxID=114890 RepID=A0AC35TQK6_9BILA